MRHTDSFELSRQQIRSDPLALLSKLVQDKHGAEPRNMKVTEQKHLPNRARRVTLEFDLEDEKE